MSADLNIDKTKKSLVPADAKSLVALAQRMARVYVGNTSHHYTADFRFMTVEPSGKKVPRYTKIEGPPTVDEFVAHLSGVKGLLIVPIAANNACRWGKIDVDVYSLDPKKFAAAIHRWKLPLIVERSKSGGFHLAHYHPYLIPCADMQELLIEWAVMLHCPEKVEIFPKQSTLGPKEDGSGINLPYFNAVNASDCTNFAIDENGDKLSVEAWLDFIERMPAKAGYTPGQVNVEAIADILGRHWTEGQRDNLNLAAIGTLIRAGLEDDVIQEATDKAADIGGDDAVRRKVSSVRADMGNGKHIPGFTRLKEIIGQEDAREILRNAGTEAPPELVPFEIRGMPADWATDLPPPVQFAVEPLFPRKVTAVVAAEGGTGKTGFGLAAAVAVASGRALFGMNVTQGRAVYIALEENQDSIQRRLYTILRAEEARMVSEGLSPETIEEFRQNCTANFFPVPAAGFELHFIISPKGTIQMNVPLLEALIEKLPPNVTFIVVDALARVHGSNENANEISTALINAGERIAQRTGAAFVYMHHVGKESIRTRDTSMNAARGGSGLIAGARSSVRLAPVTEDVAKKFSNVPPEVIAGGDLIEVVHNKLNDGKRAAPFYLRRQAFAFERFEPKPTSGDGLSQRRLAALFDWFCRGGRKGFSENQVIRSDERRGKAFGGVITRADAKTVIADAVEDGDLVKAPGPKPKGGKPLLLFREDFAVPM